MARKPLPTLEGLTPPKKTTTKIPVGALAQLDAERARRKAATGHDPTYGELIAEAVADYYPPAPGELESATVPMRKKRPKLKLAV